MTSPPVDHADATGGPPKPPPKKVLTREHHRSLRSKLVLGVAMILLAFYVAHEAVRREILRRELAVLQTRDASRDLNRALLAIRAEGAHLGDLVHTLTQAHTQTHTHTHTHARTDAKAQADAHARGPTIALPDTVDWAFTLHADASADWIRPSHSAPDEGQLSVPAIRRLHHGIVHCGRQRCRGTWEAWDGSIAIFAAAPWPTPADPEAQSPADPETHLVIGKWLDDEFLSRLSRRTRTSLALRRTQGEWWRGNREGLAITATDKDGQQLLESPLVEFGSYVPAYLQVPVRAELSVRGRHANGLARSYLLFGSVAALLALIWMLQRTVIAPIASIRRHTERIAEEGLAAGSLELKVNDELGDLAKAFDRMTTRLSDAQRSLRESSRAAGARQVADTVIHNIGNVLTNVNSLLDAANAQVVGLRVPPLMRLADRLRDAPEDRELLDATPGYLRSLAESLTRDQKQLGQLLGTLGGNLRHIHDVIRAQRKHVGTSLCPEPLTIGELLDEAIDCCQAKFGSDQIRVLTDGPARETIRSDRALLLQVFINIVSNAGDSLRRKPGDDRRLTIRVESRPENVQIHFSDNGIGMDRQTLQRAFDAHFTTRQSGSGLGLHFCALAVSRLGGSMRATSGGPGRGATFVVELPRTPPETNGSDSGSRRSGQHRGREVAT